MAMPAFMNNNRQAIRGEINPLDKSTIVSVYPREFVEVKPTIQPGIFKIPAGSPEKPSVLVVGSSSWWREIDEHQPLLEIPVGSIQVAKSIVQDFANSLMASNGNDRMPGLFYVQGSFNVEQIKSLHQTLLNSAIQKQRNWYQALVKIADILWARSQGNPLSISDEARLAARELNLNDKEWLKDYQTIEKINCPACGSLHNPLFPVCANCKFIVDPVKAKAMKMEFAAQ